MENSLDVNITNVISITPFELAQWVSANLLDIRIPVPGPNHVVNIQTEIMPKIATIANRMSLATELYNICVGAKAPWTNAKKDPTRKADAELAVTTLSAHIDILYRTIQTLDAQRESASRLMTGITQVARLNM